MNVITIADQRYERYLAPKALGLIGCFFLGHDYQPTGEEKGGLIGQGVRELRCACCGRRAWK